MPTTPEALQTTCHKKWVPFREGTQQVTNAYKLAASGTMQPPPSAVLVSAAGPLISLRAIFAFFFLLPRRCCSQHVFYFSMRAQTGVFPDRACPAAASCVVRFRSSVLHQTGPVSLRDVSYAPRAPAILMTVGTMTALPGVWQPLRRWPLFPLGHVGSGRS